MKTTFKLTLFNDESVKEKLLMMSQLDVMFDDERNVVPNEYYDIVDNIQIGESITITVEKI